VFELELDEPEFDEPEPEPEPDDPLPMCGHRWVLVVELGVVAVELGVDAVAGVTAAAGVVAGFADDGLEVAAWAIAPPARMAETPTTAANLRPCCRDIAHLPSWIGVLGGEGHQATLGMRCEGPMTVV
jgi:hypothetical protein